MAELWEASDDDDGDIQGWITKARDALDGFEERGWIAWAGTMLMPRTAKVAALEAAAQKRRAPADRMERAAEKARGQVQVETEREQSGRQKGTDLATQFQEKKITGAAFKRGMEGLTQGPIVTRRVESTDSEEEIGETLRTRTGDRKKIIDVEKLTTKDGALSAPTSTAVKRKNSEEEDAQEFYAVKEKVSRFYLERHTPTNFQYSVTDVARSKKMWTVSCARETQGARNARFRNRDAPGMGSREPENGCAKVPGGNTRRYEKSARKCQRDAAVEVSPHG